MQEDGDSLHMKLKCESKHVISSIGQPTSLGIRKVCDQNYENPDHGLANVAEELTKDNRIDWYLPSNVTDIARRWSIDNAIHRRGGRTYAAGKATKPSWERKPDAAGQAQEGGRFFRATLTWQNTNGCTDLDMHMICPECKQEVYFQRRQCCCTGKSWHLQLDLDDQGGRKNSEENIWLEKTSDNYDQVYELKVKLYSGRRVPFRVLFKREGHPDHMYNFQPHAKSKEKLTIFTWKSSGELKISPDRLLFDLSPWPSSPSHVDHSASATLDLEEVKTFAEEVDLSSPASLVRFLLDDRVDVKLVKGQHLSDQASGTCSDFKWKLVFFTNFWQFRTRQLQLPVAKLVHLAMPKVAKVLGGVAK